MTATSSRSQHQQNLRTQLERGEQRRDLRLARGADDISNPDKMILAELRSVTFDRSSGPAVLATIASTRERTPGSARTMTLTG